MLLTLKKDIIYGPVDSRRLGASLGINLFPGTAKVCPFNCVYCQYGWTKERRVGKRRRALIPAAKDVARAVEEALRALPSPPAYLTFSGNGEPTLHPDFPEIVEAVKAARDRVAPGAKTAILSNSALAGEERIRRTLAGLDVRIMKLDCGREEVFERYNGPAHGITLESVTEGLAELSRLVPVTIQSLWTGGDGGNLRECSTANDSIPSPPHPSLGPDSEVGGWIERLKGIRPAFVQVYSLDRDTPARNLRKLDRSELDDIASLARSAGIPASSFVR